MSLTKKLHIAAQNNVPLLSVLAVGLVITSLTLTLVSQYAVLPVQGTIAKVNALLHLPSINMSPVAVNGAEASFAYPRSFKPAAAQAPNGPVLASYALSTSDLETSRLSVSVISVPSGDLHDNNAYQFRQLHASDYVETHSVVNGTPVATMTAVHASGFGETAFLVHNGRQAVIALSGSSQDNAEQLQSVLAMVISSWRWHP